MAYIDQGSVLEQQRNVVSVQSTEQGRGKELWALGRLTYPFHDGLPA